MPTNEQSERRICPLKFVGYARPRVMGGMPKDEHTTGCEGKACPLWRDGPAWCRLADWMTRGGQDLRTEEGG